MLKDIFTAMNTGPASIILWQSLAIFLIVGALMGIAVSLILLLKPQFMAPISRMANRWISTRHMCQLLDRTTSIEQWFYLHHRPLGILIASGACYILVYFGLLFNKPSTMRRLSVYAPGWLLDILLDSLALVSLIGAAVALFAGLFLWLRPSLLHGIEKEANRWVSIRQAVKPLSIQRDQVERFVAGHLQLVGWLLLVGSTYLLFAVFRTLA